MTVTRPIAVEAESRLPKPPREASLCLNGVPWSLARVLAYPGLRGSLLLREKYCSRFPRPMSRCNIDRRFAAQCIQFHRLLQILVLKRSGRAMSLLSARSV